MNRFQWGAVCAVAWSTWMVLGGVAIADAAPAQGVVDRPVDGSALQQRAPDPSVGPPPGSPRNGQRPSGAADAARSGFDPGLAASAVQQARALPRLHTLLVARHGRTEIEHVAAGPGLDQPANVKSLSKTILSALVGMAIDRGVIDGDDQPIAALLGDRIDDASDPRVREITIGHLLSMRAGLERTSGRNYDRWVTSGDWVGYALSRPFVDDPGGRMLYSTGSSHIVSAALTEATGQTTLELARSWLGEPLDVIVPAWTRDPQGIYFGGNDMHLSPRALLRFGEMYRQGGHLDGRRILSERWIETSWKPRGRSAYTGDAYGYGWFMTVLDDVWVYYGRGYGGQMLYVIPELAMTVVITSDPTPPSPGGPYLRQLNELVAAHLIPAARTASRMAASGQSDLALRNDPEASEDLDAVH